MGDKEQKVMGLYRETRPGVFQGEPSTMRHLPWSLLVIALGLIFWLVIALINAENQRNALITRACQDRVFKEEVDSRCLALVQTRPHWWQHVTYALSHVR